MTSAPKNFLATSPVLVVVGVTGDLAKRKLLPALRALSERGAMPFGRVIGTSRRTLVLGDLLAPDDPLREVFEVASLPPEDSHAYAALAERLGQLGGEAFFYLAVPPGSAGPIAQRLADAGCRGTLVLEKPFGMDAASAQLEAARIAAAFGERVVRVDHYLLKPLAARLMAQAPGRGAARIEVLAAEALGLEGRVDFYDATGALRDTGNHLLSLLGAALGAGNSAERLRELKQLSVVRAQRGQYEGYAREVGHATDTETFISLELAHREHPDLSIVLTSGKALGKKQTAVRVVAGGKTTEFAETPLEESAHERLFAALAHKEPTLFLGEAEAMESWRLLDAARQAWGDLRRYATGSAPLAVN